MTQGDGIGSPFDVVQHDGFEIFSAEKAFASKLKPLFAGHTPSGQLAGHSGLILKGLTDQSLY